jgi:hypothetical protein
VGTVPIARENPTRVNDTTKRQCLLLLLHLLLLLLLLPLEVFWKNLAVEGAVA